MSLFKELNSLMVKYAFRPNRKLGQLFIVDSKVVDILVETADLRQEDVVLEIGAGTGFLTRELQKRCSVVAVELDDVLFELLEAELSKKNLVLLHGNFLELQLPSFNKVVSLPPYTISSETMYRLFKLGFERAVLVFQTEFAERLTAKPGFLDYNALSVLTQYFCDVRIVQRVPARAFFPAPRTESVIVELVWKKREKEVCDADAFKRFVKCLFRFQNKNLCNALKNSFEFLQSDFKVSREDFEKKIRGLDLRDVKVKLISSDEFVSIFSVLSG
jgi:16S rRNA (adenine1518-N6/adenine1519-N6)-dimethyltransferase